MTDKQKAKAYDEALERAQKVTRAGGDVAMVIVQDIFPELAESEDERIRKEIIDFIQWAEDRGMTRHDYHQAKRPAVWIAYLERQKDSKWSPSESEMGVLYKLCYISNQVTDEDDTNLTRLYQDLKREYFNGHSFENMFPSEKQKESLPISEICKENANSFIDGIIEVRSFQRGMEEGRKLEKQEEQKPVECIEFDNEFEKQVSHLLASVLNGEWEYNEDFVKYAAQSLLGYAKNEMKPDEWDKREKLFRKALQAANARIGQLFEENQKLKEQKLEKYAQRLQKEQKQAQTSDEKEYIRTIKSIISDFIRDKKPENLAYYQRIYDWLDGRHVPFSCGHENGKQADPVFSKQEYESHPIISTDTTSVKPVEFDGKTLLYTADKSYQIGFRDGVASVKQEWSEEDEEMRDTCIDLLEHFPRPCGAVIGPWKDCIDWLKSLPEKFNLQSKQECGKVTINGEPVSAENHSVDIPLAEWSKEDEEIYTFVCNFFETCWWSKTWDISREQVLQMLKSLPEKFVLQPKQEWSEEDENALKYIHELLVFGYTEKFMDAQTAHDMRKWVNEHLRTDTFQNGNSHWKPSEQEKGALRTAIHVLTEERNFPKAAAQLQNILDAFEGKESRKDWKPSEEQKEALEYVIRDYREDSCNATANYLQEILDHLKNM